MASLDMSLEDRIKNNKMVNKRGGRGQGRPGRGRGQGVLSRGGRPFGAPRRNPLGVNTRPSASSIAKTIRRPRNSNRQTGLLLQDSLKAAGLSVIETGTTKLYISNLDLGVTSEDLRELFSEFGELIRYTIHYDRNGRPSGSADLVFARRSDAFQAVKRYNGVQLDGKPMKIEIIGGNVESNLSARVNIVGGGNGRRTVIMGPGNGAVAGGGRFRGGFVAANRGFGQRGRGGSNGNATRGGLNGGSRGGRGGRGRGSSGAGRGRGSAAWTKKNVVKSADELDKDLENYHAGAAMET